MQTHSLLLWLLSTILLLGHGCSKFDWGTTEHYDLQSMPILVASNAIDEAPLPDSDGMPAPMNPHPTSGVPHPTKVASSAEQPQTKKDLTQPNTPAAEDVPHEESSASEDTPSSEGAKFDQVIPIDADSPSSMTRDASPVDSTSPVPKPPPETPACIDLNHADRDTLMQLPGVGERRALDIMARRTKHPFRHKRDITRIKGIGPKTYARMKDRLCDP